MRGSPETNPANVPVLYLLHSLFHFLLHYAISLLSLFVPRNSLKISCDAARDGGNEKKKNGCPRPSYSVNGWCSPPCRELAVLVTSICWSGMVRPFPGEQRAPPPQWIRMFAMAGGFRCSYAWAWRASSIFDRIRKKANQVGKERGARNFAIEGRWARTESAS